MPLLLGISLWVVIWGGGRECLRNGDGKETLYLEIGDGIGNGKPGSPGVLLGTKRAIESLRDGTEVEGADSRSGNAVSGR